MNSLLAIDKIELRLNKLASSDYQNLDTWKKEEALNKGLENWLRRQIKGKNILQDGDEENTSRVDDLSVLLKHELLPVLKKDLYSELDIPKDYQRFKRLTPIVSNDTCKSINIKSSLVEEANVDELLTDYSSQPSIDFEETFHTKIGNKFTVYHNNNFTIDKVKLTYYKKPAYIHLVDITKASLDWEFGEDVCEEIIDEAVKIIAGDTENTIQYELADKRIETNN